MKCDEFQSVKSEFFVAAAGPLLNLILMFIGAVMDAKSFFIANFFMLVINLLPVYPLDGGRIMYTFLKNEISLLSLKRVLKYTSVIITVFLCVMGCVLICKTGINFSVLTAAMFLSLTADRVDLKIPEETVKKSVHYTVKIEQYLKNVLKYRKKNTIVIFDVVDTSEHYVGSVTYREVLEKIADFGYEIKFSEIL